MNTLRQTCAATILTLVLAASALAGQIECPTATQSGPTGNYWANSSMRTAILTIIDLIR